MPILRIEPVSLHLAAQTLRQGYFQLADQAFLLHVQYYRLEMAWQGGNAEEYLYELTLLLKRMEQRLDELLSLSLTLSRQAEAWEECDQRWAGLYREGSIFLPGS